MVDLQDEVNSHELWDINTFRLPPIKKKSN